MTKKDLLAEFEKQTEKLLQKGYATLLNKTHEEFVILLKPLKEQIIELDLPAIDIEHGYLPFVIVIKNNFVSTEKAMSLVEKDGKPGITKLFPLQSTDFTPLSEVTIPNNMAYAIVAVDRGKETLNIRPHEAMKTITNENRSPLTIDEGVAIITHHPEFLIKNNCFSLLASRHRGDKRVPAIWINANKNPNLGWCWDGNPHTWLGSASCKRRI